MGKKPTAKDLPPELYRKIASYAAIPQRTYPTHTYYQHRFDINRVRRLMSLPDAIGSRTNSDSKREEAAYNRAMKKQQVYEDRLNAKEAITELESKLYQAIHGKPK